MQKTNNPIALLLTHHSPYMGKNIETTTTIPRPFVLKIDKFGHQNKPCYYLVGKTTERVYKYDGPVDYLAKQTFSTTNSGKQRIYYELEEA